MPPRPGGHWGARTGVTVSQRVPKDGAPNKMILELVDAVSWLLALPKSQVFLQREVLREK